MASYALVIAAPLGLYVLLVHPDWDLLYRIDPKTLPAWILFLAPLSSVAAVIAGYAGGALLERWRGARALYAALALALVALVALVIVAAGPLGSDGTYAAYHSGEARSLRESKLPWVLAVMLLGMGAAAVTVGRAIAAEGRRPVSRRNRKIASGSSTSRPITPPSQSPP